MHKYSGQKNILLWQDRFYTHLDHKRKYMRPNDPHNNLFDNCILITYGVPGTRSVYEQNIRSAVESDYPLYGEKEILSRKFLCRMLLVLFWDNNWTALAKLAVIRNSPFQNLKDIIYLYSVQLKLIWVISDISSEYAN